ncbi:MAG: zinc-binding alcohol dehydrogenase family protein [Myxococcota bacterium]
MKAAVYYDVGGPEVLRYEEVSDPVCRSDGVVIDVRAVSLEGGDLLHRAGGELTSRPHVVGYQCAGRIREVGTAVSDRKVGDPVVAVMPHGSHAERAAVQAAATWVVPEGLGLERAATVPIPFGTADDCLFEFGHLQAGERVLIQAGAGGVGLAAIQLARRAGARVAATASSAAKLARLKTLGVECTIQYREQDLVAAVREWTEGRGVDLVVDSVGGRTLEKSIDAARYRGRIISVGRAGRDALPADTSALMPGNKTLTGVFFGAELMLARERVHPMVQAHLEAIARGELQAILDRSFALSDAAAAHAYVESRRALGRVLLIP